RRPRPVPDHMPNRSAPCRSAARDRARRYRWSCLDLLGQLVGVVGACLVHFALGLDLVDRLTVLDLVRQPRRRLAHVELAGDDVGDQAGAVLAEEVDLTTSAVNSLLKIDCILVGTAQD